MAASFYDKKDVPQFQEDVCKKTCIRKGRCIEENKDDHWFLMCPHYHQWKLGYEDSYVVKYLRWEREHLEEAEKKHLKNVERAKEWKKTKQTKKSSKPSEE